MSLGSIVDRNCTRINLISISIMFHILSSCAHQQDPWSYNFMRVMSRAFWLHQNINPSLSSIYDPCISSLHHFVLSTNTSSRKRPATLSSHKLYTKCFTSRHHVISNKIHDLTTLCASCHECFDCIKTFHTSCHRSYRSLHHNPSSLRLVNNTSSKNFARISIVDRFDLFKSLKL